MKAVTDVQSVVDHLAGLKGDTLTGDEGVQWGDIHHGVTAIQVCWMATVPAIEAAAARGADLIVAHEELLYPYPLIRGRERPANHLGWDTNRRRLEALAAHGISVIRLHGTMDRICILDVFARDLGLDRPVEQRDHFTRLYETEPRTIRQWIDHVKQVTGMPHLRVTPCDLDRTAGRLALVWGGTALFVNVEFMQGLIEMKPDLLVAGESDCYGFLFALGAGIPLIETSHEVSENHGVEVFAKQLAGELDVPVTYYDNERCWEVR